MTFDLSKTSWYQFYNLNKYLLQYGLYGSFLGTFIYIFFGSSKDVPFGPSAIVSLLTYQTVAQLDSPVEHAILLCCLCGIIQFFMGIFGLGESLNSAEKLFLFEML